MKISSPVLAAAIILLPASAFAEEIQVEGVRISRDFACDGQDVVIAGQGNTVELKGRCGTIKVIGTDHKVTFDDARALVVSGMSNAATGGAVASLAVEVTQNAVKATLKQVEGGGPRLQSRVRIRKSIWCSPGRPRSWWRARPTL